MNKSLLIAGISTALLSATTAGYATEPKARPDAGLYTTYSLSPTSVNFVVCGQLPGSEGCYGSGSLSPPFEQACAVVEGTPKYKKDVVTREIYVLDKRTETTTPIQLYVFTRTDTITNSGDSIQVSQTNQVSLTLTGGAQSQCAMAANAVDVYAGTSADTVAAAMSKSNFGVTTLGGFSPPANIVSITADDRGYVTLHFTEGFYVFGPNGGGEEDGGGAADMVGTTNAWIPAP